MPFFKHRNDTTDKNLLRLERTSWICIYGGLLALVLGYFITQQGSSATRMFIGGFSALVLGVLQILLRAYLGPSAHAAQDARK